MARWDPDTEVYTRDACPGKVDAYRFKSYYLPPDLDNTKKLTDPVRPIVDPVWQYSSDPDAVALRGAATDQPVWRVLHRVTYVSRVPAPFGTAPDQTVAPEPDRAIDVADNEALLLLIDAALKKANPSLKGVPTSEQLGNAIAAVMNPAEQNHSYPKSQLGEVVPWWETFLATTRGSNQNPGNVALLERLQFDTMSYAWAAYASGQWKIQG